MKSQLEELLEAGQDLIGQIEDAKESLRVDITNLNEAVGEIDNTIDQVSGQADELERQITAVLNELPHQKDPVALATTEAIDNLITLLTEAKNYYATGENGAAFGTLIMFEEHAEDLNAAIRLCRMAAKRRAK